MTPPQYGTRLASAALSLRGVRFRLHGRDPETGLDRAGLLEAALTRCGAPIRLPNGYPLRARKVADPSPLFATIGLMPAAGTVDVRAGDVLLLRPHPCQHHIAVATCSNRIVHAHAALRCVVHSSLPATWLLAGHWRFSPHRS